MPLIFKQWRSIVDSRTTIVCLHAAGMLREPDEPFDILGVGPLDHPPAHIHCRALVVPWMPGFIDDTRRAANEELQRRPLAQRRIGPGGEIGARIPPMPRDIVPQVSPDLKQALTQSRSGPGFTLPKPASLPHDADGLTSDQLAKAKRDLPLLKADVRETARKVKEEAQAALDAADVFEMAPPYAKGSEEARSSGLYDWFYSLHPDEQTRLRQGWMKGHRQVANPDLIATRITNLYGGEDFDTAINRWLDDTRRFDAAGAVARGRVPAPTRYGGEQLDVDGIFGDGTHHVADLFDSDPKRATRSVAASTEAQSEEFADRTFAKPADGTALPYEMSEADYTDEVARIRTAVANAVPIHSDPDFGDQYSPEDEKLFRRFDELVPADIEDYAALSGFQLWRRIIDLARKAGLL